MSGKFLTLQFDGVPISAYRYLHVDISGKDMRFYETVLKLKNAAKAYLI